MNVFLNVFITPEYLSSLDRRNIKNAESKVDIFKWMITSIACIENINHVFIYCALAPEYESRKEEINLHIQDSFSQCKSIKVSFYRNMDIGDWQNSIREVLDTGDDLTIFMNNHDHIFIGNNFALHDVIDDLYSSTNRLKSIYASHYAVILSTAYFDRHREYEHSFSIRMKNRDSIQILTRETLHHWFFETHLSPNIFGRTDQHTGQGEPIEIFAPFCELFRHFDGYHMIAEGGRNNYHTIHNYNMCPPLRMPSDNKIILYGFDDTNNDYIDINPTKHLKDLCHITGTDYKVLDSEIPDMFIKNGYQIIKNNNINQDIFIAERKKHIIAVARDCLDKYNESNLRSSRNIEDIDFFNKIVKAHTKHWSINV